MNLVRVARYAAWCRERHRPLDGATRFQASTVAQAHKGSCVRRTDVGTDRRWFGESGRTVKPPESSAWIYLEGIHQCRINRVNRGG